MSDAGGDADTSVKSAPDRRRDAIHVTVGAGAIVCWGLFFDQLARAGRWILDTTYPLSLHRLADLQFRLRDAHDFLSRHHLYGSRPGAFTYPPFAAFVFAPLRALGTTPSEVLWTVGNLVALALLLALVMWRWLDVRLPAAWMAAGCGLAPASVFVLYPFHSLLIWGQMAVFVLLAVFVDLFVVPPRFRGVLIGVVTAIKLLPGLFVAWLVLRRDVPGAIRACATFVVLTVGAWIYWPAASSKFWFHLLPSGRDELLAVDPLGLSGPHSAWYLRLGKTVNQSLRGLLARPPFEWTGTFPWIALALVALGLGLWVTYRLVRDDRELTAFVVMSVTTVLVSPVSWVHYWVFAVLAPFVAVVEWRRDRATSIAAMVLAVAVCADLEDTTLTGLFLSGHHFSSMSPVVVFIVRNLYVLGGIAFLGVVAQRALGGSGEQRAAAPVASSAPS